MAPKYTKATANVASKRLHTEIDREMKVENQWWLSLASQARPLPP